METPVMDQMIIRITVEIILTQVLWGTERVMRMTHFTKIQPTSKMTNTMAVQDQQIRLLHK
jgi:hypothetical protein